MSVPRPITVAAVLVMLSACDSRTLGVSGVWEGTVAGNTLPGGLSMQVTLTETEFGVISGAGFIRLNNGFIFSNGSTVLPVTASGAHTFPSVALHISGGGIQPMNYQGQLDNGLARIVGVVNGSGFLGDSLRLVRMPQAPAAHLTAP